MQYRSLYDRAMNLARINEGEKRIRFSLDAIQFAPVEKRWEGYYLAAWAAFHIHRFEEAVKYAAHAASEPLVPAKIRDEMMGLIDNLNRTKGN